jgi:hypothetical protein
MSWPSVIGLVVIVAAAGSQTPSPTPPAAPLPPVAASASAVTDLWRRVLAMDDAQREAFISSKPAASQAFLRSKVQEFLVLPPEKREMRLRALELRAYMLPLMRLPAPARAQQIEQLPSDKRSDVKKRLLTWDIMPPQLQKDVLENEAAIRLVMESGNRNASREELLAAVAPARRAEMETNLIRWNEISPAQQDQMVSNFERYFGQPLEERGKALRTLNEGDLAIITPTLNKLERMPDGERDRVLDGIRKFKSLPPAAQKDFVRAAAKWQAMTDKDRQLWRQLVTTIHARSGPPMPPPIPRATSENRAAQ